MKKSLSFLVPAAVALASLAPAVFAITAAPPAGINGFSDPGGFTLNANSGGYLGQDATAHGVPTISGGTLHLTTSQGMAASFMSGGMTYDTFYGDERTSAFAKTPQYIGVFTASFTYQNNGPNPNPQSFGPGDALIFVVQNDPRGASALGDDGAGYGAGGGTGIVPSAGIAYNLFTGFGDSRGPALVTNGNNDAVTHTDSSPVNLVSGDPIAVTISYDGVTLSESLVDTITRASFSTRYPLNLPAQLGSSYGYVGFTGGTGAAVEDQYVSNFIFSNAVPPAPVNTGPQIAATATVSSADAKGNRIVTVTTTNNGGVNADQFTYTSVTLGAATPAPVPVSPSPVPTTPNLLSSHMSQVNKFSFAPSPGTKMIALHLLATYQEPRSLATDTFISTLRLTLP